MVTLSSILLRRASPKAIVRLFVCANVFLAQLLFISPTHADSWSYTLRPGDDLWSIAQRFCGSGKLAEKIAQHNGLQRAAAVTAGHRIDIPVAWLTFAPSSAQIRTTRGEVYVYRANETSDTKLAAKQEMQLYMGDRLTTDEGAATVEFADSSTIRIEPDSDVLFNKLTAFGPAGMVDTHLRFTYGRAEARVKPRNQGARFRIQMPEGVAAVRGTVFRVGHNHQQPNAATRVETTEGEVAFAQPETANATTDVPAGYGVAASATGVVKESLLPAPVWVASAQTLTTEDTISWQPLQGATSYVVGWFDANRPDLIISQDFVGNATRDFAVPATKGNYVVQVRGVSGSGIEGFNATRTLAVVEPAPQLDDVAQSNAGPWDQNLMREVVLDWSYAADSTFDVTLTGPQGNRTFTTSDEHLYANLEPGKYSWQVQPRGGVASAPSTFELNPPQPQITTQRKLGRSIEVSWPAVSNANTHYSISVSQQGTEVYTQPTTKQTSHTVTLPEFGNYTVRVVQHTNNLESTAATADGIVQRRPWWLLLLLVPLL